MFAVIKTPLSLAAVVALAAACSSGVSMPSVPGVATESAVPAATVPALASAPIVETPTTVYQTAPAYTQPSLAATQAPLSIDAPSFIDVAPVVDSSLIQPASVSTFNAPTITAPTLPSYTIPAAPSAPVVSPEYLIEPTIAPITDGFSQLPSLNDTSIIAASARTSDLPIIASNSPLLAGTVYATTLGDLPTAD